MAKASNKRVRPPPLTTFGPYIQVEEVVCQLTYQDMALFHTVLSGWSAGILGRGGEVGSMSGGGGGTAGKPPVSVSMSSSALTSTSALASASAPAVIDFSRGGDELGLLTGPEDTARAARAAWEGAGFEPEAVGDGGMGGEAGEGARRTQVGWESVGLFRFLFLFVDVLLWLVLLFVFCGLRFVVLLFVCLLLSCLHIDSFEVVLYTRLPTPRCGYAAAFLLMSTSWWPYSAVSVPTPVHCYP